MGPRFSFSGAVVALYEPFNEANRAKRTRKNVALVVLCVVVFVLAVRVIPYFLEPALTNVLRQPLW